MLPPSVGLAVGLAVVSVPSEDPAQAVRTPAASAVVAAATAMRVVRFTRVLSVGWLLSTTKVGKPNLGPPYLTSHPPPVSTPSGADCPHHTQAYPGVMAVTRAALIVIDVQAGFDDARWGRRNNPEAEANIARLVGTWRGSHLPLVLVRHDSVLPGSPLAAGQPGNALRGFVDGPADLFVTKNVNSAFYGEPDLDRWLHEQGITDLVICGVQTNFCCETTARMAGNLGYRVRFVLDATHTFDRVAPDGSVISAEELARVSATNLNGEFAEVVSTVDVLTSLD